MSDGYRYGLDRGEKGVEKGVIWGSFWGSFWTPFGGSEKGPPGGALFSPPGGDIFGFSKTRKKGVFLTPQSKPCTMICPDWESY